MNTKAKPGDLPLSWQQPDSCIHTELIKKNLKTI